MPFADFSRDEFDCRLGSENEPDTVFRDAVAFAAGAKKDKHGKQQNAL